MGWFGGGGGSAPPPDPQVGAAAMRNAQTAKDQLDFTKQQYADEKAYTDSLMPMVKHLLTGQSENFDLTNSLAKKSNDEYEQTFRPIETQFAGEAEEAGTPGMQDAMAGRAGADVQTAIDTQRNATDAALASEGVNPNSSRFVAANRANDILGAAAQAGAETNARLAERDRGLTLQQNAVSIGRGLPAQAIQSVQSSNQSAGGALGTAQTPFNMNMAAGQQFISGTNASVNSNTSAASILNNQYANEIEAAKVNQTAGKGFGSLASIGLKAVGAGMGAASGGGWAAALGVLSDESVKTDKRPFSGKEAIKAIKAMRVERWRYKDGVADAGEHVGTYAQDFAKATGIGDGKSIDVISALGVTQAAVKALIEKVDRMPKHSSAVALGVA